MPTQDAPERLPADEPQRELTDEEISEIERQVQLRGFDDPDNIFLPDGRSVTQARADVRAGR